MKHRLANLGLVVATTAALVIPLQVLSTPSANAIELGGLSASTSSSWQANATVWKMAYGAGDIWMVGDFTSLRPPGAALGTGEQPANYFAALRASTGAPDPAVNDTHTFTGQPSGTLPLRTGAVAVSPNGSTVYVGGSFTTVDGQSRNHIAAFSTTTGALLPWNPGVGGVVKAIGVSPDNNTVYIGGAFGKVGKTTVGPNVAAISASTGLALSWGPNLPGVDNTVDALGVSADGSQVVIGGYFSHADGLTQSADGKTIYNKAAIIGGVTSSTPGALEPMPADVQAVPPGTDSAPVNGCYSDVKDIVISGGAAYIANEGTGGGCFDGTWAVNLNDGSLKWVNNCLGATQTLAVVGPFLYKGSHIHNCQWTNTNNDPDNFPQVTNRHASSEYLTNGFLGPWYPDVNAGPNLGPRAMATDGSQLYMGGDFTTVNHIGQQSIARFTTNNDYPTPKPATPIAVPGGSGSVNVFAQAPVDLDDPDLTMELFRDGGSTAVATVNVHSLFWRQPVVGFTDSGLTPGTKHTYQVDAFETNDPGATHSPKSAASPQVTVNATSGSYASAVQSQNPVGYWRFGEPSGVIAADSSPALDGGSYNGGVTLGQAGGILGDSNTAAKFDGSTGYFSSSQQVPSPTTFSVDAWFKTTTTSGGKIIGFGDSQTGDSSNYDKHIYMTNSGQLIFGAWNGHADIIQTSKSYNNGAWHEVIGTQGPSGMTLYVDGVKVGGNSATTNQSYPGYWRVGEDNLNGWPNQPSSNYFAGTIDDVSVYNTALTPSQVGIQYTAAGYTLPPPPPQSTTPYAQSVLADGPSLYWRLDESSGSTALDLSGNGDNGTYGSGDTLGTPGAVSDGKPDTAITTDGNDDGVMVGATQVPSPSAFSVEAWFKTTHAGGKIVGFGDSSSPTGSGSYDKHIYFNSDGSLNFGVWNGEADVVSTIPTTTNLTDGQWHQVVGTQGPSGMALYVDGVKVASNTVTTNQSYNGYWHVGGDSGWSNNGNDFNGSIDEVSVYPYALSLSQVDSQYNTAGYTVAAPQGSNAPYAQNVLSNSPSLYWRLDETSGTTAQDLSGNGDNGTYGSGDTLGVPGAINDGSSPADGAITTDGNDDGVMVGSSQVPSPSTFSVEAWFKTTHAGGKIIGFGNSSSPTGSSSYDKHIYFNSDGSLNFGVYNGEFDVVSAPGSMNLADGNWHQVVGTQDGSGMNLYIDGNLIASNGVTTNQSYNGYWHVGGDSGWSDNTNDFNGSIDEVSVYPYALSASQIQGDYDLGSDTTPPPPSAPSQPTVTSSSDTTADINWSAVSGATSYQVERSAHNANSFSNVGSPVSGTSVHDTGLTPGASYDYVVVANGSGGPSNPSPIQSVTLAPAQPGTLTATANGTGEIDLSWGASQGATSYEVYRGPGGSGNPANDLGPASGTTFNDTGLNPGDSYDYQVVPYSGTVAGAASNISTGTTLPAQVTGLATTNVTASEVDLAWNPAAGANTYRVERAPAGSGNWQAISTGSNATSYADTGVSTNTGYDYQVAAVNAGGKGAYSATLTVTTPVVAPGKVTGLSVTNLKSTEVDLGWTATPGATAYEVDRSTVSASGPFSPVQTGLTSPSYNDTGLSPSTHYWYQVIASNSAGPGPASDPASATTPSLSTLLLSNSFDGGTNGTAVTAANSGGASGNALNAVSCTSGTVTYSNASTAHGTESALLAPTTALCYMQWSKAITATSEAYGRAYVKFAANPTAAFVLMKPTDASFGRDVQVNLSKTGKLSILDANGTTQSTFTNSVPLNSWVRLEWHLISAASGTFELRMYAGDSTTPIESHVVTGVNTGTTIGAYQIGALSPVSGGLGTTIGIDDLGFGSGGWLGPAS
jgi:fibronectin type 3 domain-containing protein